MYKESDVAYTISKLSVDRKLQSEMFIFMKLYPFTDKKIDLFLKLKTSKERLGFIHRFILTASYEYGVPRIYITDYKSYKNIIKRYIKSNKKIDDDVKDRLNLKSRMLLIATIELMRNKNSRQEKIQKLMEKIQDSKN